MASKVKTSVRLRKESLAWSLSCTWVAQTLGQASMVTGSTGARAHRCRGRSPMGCEVESGALADDHESWGKRSAMVQGLGLPKESANGQVAQRLAGDG
jgi:hypothetical protein